MSELSASVIRINEKIKDLDDLLAIASALSWSIYVALYETLNIGSRG